MRYTILSYSLFGMIIILSLSKSNAQWVQTNGPMGGQIECITVTDNHIFVGTRKGGIFHSSDDGATWMSINKGIPPKDIRSLATFGTNILAGTLNEGIYLSSDYGLSWIPFNNGLVSVYDKTVSSILIKDTNIFIGTYHGGVFRSSDTCKSWVAVNSGIGQNDVRALATKNEMIFAGTWGWGVYLSTNNGDSWASINNGLTDRTVNCLAIGSDSLRSIFVGTYHGVFRSTNDGLNWVNVDSGLYSKYVTSIACRDKYIFVGTYNFPNNGGVFVSTNNGDRWELGYTIDDDIFSIAATDSNVFVGTVSGVYRSSDHGYHWISVNQGIIGTEVYSIHSDDVGLFVGTWGGGIFYSSNKGASWVPKNTSLRNKYIMSLTGNNQNLYAGTCGDGVFTSSNEGHSWVDPFYGLWYPTSLTIRSLYIKDTYLFAGTAFGLFRLFENSYQWINADTGIYHTDIKCIISKGSNLFAGTDVGVFLTTNDGHRWIEVDSGINNLSITSLASNDEIVVAGTNGGGLYISTNDGTSWDSINNELSGKTVLSFAIKERNIFVSTLERGVLLSTNDGQSWNTVNDGLTDNVKYLAIYGTDLYAGTNCKGVWRRPLTEMITKVEDSKPVLPGNFVLDQNYPNPFNSMTIISYQLPFHSKVTLKVFDLLGREVFVLVNSIEEPGYKSVSLNGNDLASGLYYYRLQVDNYVATKKLLLIK